MVVTDGASNMESAFVPKYNWLHCMAHRLHLAFKDAIGVGRSRLLRSGFCCFPRPMLISCTILVGDYGPQA